MRCDGETLTYEQLARRANGLARVLGGPASRTAARVAVWWLGKGPNVLVAFYGVLAAGGALVPIDPKWPFDGNAEILRATGATHLVSEADRRDLVGRALAACPEVGHVIGLASGKFMPVPCVREGDGPRAGERPCARSFMSSTRPTSSWVDRPAETNPAHPPQRDELVDWAASEYTLTSDDRLTNHSSRSTPALRRSITTPRPALARRRSS